MLNYIWCVMILLGIVFAACTGNIGAITDGALDSSSEAVSLCITMFGVISVWTGLMEIAKKCGIINMLTRKSLPLMKFLFKDVPPDSKAMEYLTTNMIANFLGLGWAATPAAISAMKELSELNNHSESASNAMCTFLVINISSVQLIPVNIITYRMKYGSVAPTSIIGPAIVATIISTVVAIIFCKIMERIGKK